MKRLLTFLLTLSILFLPLEARRRWIPVIVTSVPFNPQTQGTLVNWYDASTLGLSNNANIVTWTDSKTGAPNSLTTTGTNPVYKTGVQNGLNTALFYPASSMDTGGSLASTYPITIAAVVSTLNTNEQAIMGSNSTGGLMFGIKTDSTLEWVKSGTLVIGSGSTPLPTDGTYHVVIGIITSTTYSFYVDGAAAGSGTHSVTLTAARTWQMGITNGSTILQGSVGEIQIYSSALSGSDITGAYTYLKTKWGTP